MLSLRLFYALLIRIMIYRLDYRVWSRAIEIFIYTQRQPLTFEYSFLSFSLLLTSLADKMQDSEKQPQPTEAAPSSPDKPLFPETDLSRGIVGWDGQDDPANPQNFSSTKKWSLLALISSVTLISPLASSMFSPAVGYMAAEFGESDQTLLAFSVSIFLLGYTVSSLYQLCLQ